jgi:hypothetical protein
MTTEKIINCPKSGGDLCYETQINPEISTYLSLSCGFWTNSLMKEDSEFYKEQIETLPELYKDLAWTDPKTSLIWLPNTINQLELGMVFAYGPNAQSWGWAAVKTVEVPIKEQKEINGKKQTHKMDMANMQIFHERDYIEALEYIGIFSK